MREGNPKVSSRGDDDPVRREPSLHRQLLPVATIGTESLIDYAIESALATRSLLVISVCV